MKHHRADEIAKTARRIAESPAREDYLASACAGDERLLNEVTAILLLGDDSSAQQLASPSSATSASPTPSPPLASSQPLAPTISGKFPFGGELIEKPGDLIGSYKLREEIGSGGFGVVFVADQQAPVRRRVALKMIKPGMDSREVLARFEAERQALAMMDHPNIARVFDAGPAPSGRPYFVMELVRGVRVTEYCDSHRLSLTARIALFQDICSAIQHAHQKGVIHRDIKPSNVLVTTLGDRPCVKVIDFGIAKALHEPLGEQSIYTRFAQMIGTPLYMAPEQAQLSGNAVDTRSDIYSLGVLLYVLLTGTTPIDRKRLSAADATELRRLLTEEEPPAPSTQVSRLSSKLTGSAERRSISPLEWKRALRGDLDRIVMKCLAKDPARRYQTASELADDLERFLNHQPVLARAPTFGYRLTKFARRHRFGIAVAAGFALMLIAATVVSMSLAVRAWRAETEAQRLSRREARLRVEAEANAETAEAEREAAVEAAERTQAVLTFLQEHVLSAARPRQRAGGRGINVSLRTVIDTARKQIAQHFSEQPAMEVAVRNVIGTTYWHLGEYTLAREELTRAWELARKVHGDHDLVTLDVQVNLAMALSDAGESTRAGELLVSARAELERQLDSPSIADQPEGDLLLKRLENLRKATLNDLAAVYAQTNRLAEARALYQEMWREVQQRPEATRELVRTASNYAVVLQRLQEWELAGELLEQAMRLANERLGPHHDATILLMNNLAPVYHQLGDTPHAAQMLEIALRHRRIRLSPDHPDTLTTMINLAVVRASQQRYDDAEQLYREAWEGRKRRLGEDDSRTIAAVVGLAGTLYAQQNFDESATCYRLAYQAACRSDAVPLHLRIRWGLAHVRTLESARNWQAMEQAIREMAKELPMAELTAIDRAAVYSDLARALLAQLQQPPTDKSHDTEESMKEAKVHLEQAWNSLQTPRPSDRAGGATYGVTRQRTADTWAMWYRLAGDDASARHWSEQAGIDSKSNGNSK